MPIVARRDYSLEVVSTIRIRLADEGVHESYTSALHQSLADSLYLSAMLEEVNEETRDDGRIRLSGRVDLDTYSAGSPSSHRRGPSLIQNWSRP
jgi:hypothetical protein